MSQPPSANGQKHCRLYRKRNIECRTKVKTGCTTCRIRKVKCDENKPFCQKCVNTGRTCNGYESPFRFFTSQSVDSVHTGGIKSDIGILSQTVRPTCVKITPEDVDLLNRYFSIKTIFDIQLGCDEEARQVLQASLTDAPVRHAISSLRALREDLETSGDGPAPLASIAQQTPSYHYGIEQYSMALGGLASSLSSSSLACSLSELKSALLCCQIFISIEQVQKNYAAMAQHIIRGLGIMHEYRARRSQLESQCLTTANTSAPAAYSNYYDDQVPLLDVFIIKLFAAPCKFADPPATITTASADAHVNGSSSSSSSSSSASARLLPPHQQQPTKSDITSCPLRLLAPDMRTKLTGIATSTLAFLNKISFPPSIAGNTPRLLQSEKATLLRSLDAWLTDLNLNLDRPRTENKTPQPPPSQEGEEQEGPISTSFQRLFHQVLKVILLGVPVDSSSSLSWSPDLHRHHAEVLQTENARLQSIADKVSERVRAYRMCSGSRSGGSR